MLMSPFDKHISVSLPPWRHRGSARGQHSSINSREQQGVREWLAAVLQLAVWVGMELVRNCLPQHTPCDLPGSMKSSVNL